MDNARAEKAEGNLLVVDDDLLFRQTLEALLTGEGYEVRCAPSGGMAPKFAGEDPPDLILLDIRLPDLDGFEVCRRLREDPWTGRIPVIFISGLDDVVDKVRGFAAGGVDYITLPFLSLLKGEGGKRYLLCSYCGYQWKMERLSCAGCGNKGQGSLKYFYGEGEEAYRIDLCDKCHHYIKTSIIEILKHPILPWRISRPSISMSWPSKRDIRELSPTPGVPGK
jgi:CheY-like chemotaxis protein